MRILIANRGEIARRIVRTARRLGHGSVAAYADPDRDAPFVADADHAVRLGPGDLARSYLSVDAVLTAARAAGADAVHPGYGFLSESSDLATAVTDAGLAWIGPSAEAIARMGSKIEARRLAVSAGVPVIPGSDATSDAELVDAASRIGYPVLIKASAGGGGRGIRIVDAPDRFAAALTEARAESRAAFGDDAVIVERYVASPRHIEVQIAGDRHGSVVDLGTRECSIQRRFQKLLEEAPAPGLSSDTTEAMCTAARRLAEAIGYDSVGTVEFVVDALTEDFFFLEMNTRLQVEHPVTEAVTGIDLVELQIRAAQHEPLGLEQHHIELRGHAFEARITAEDAGEDFSPQTGTVTHLVVPPGVRWDSGIEIGSVVSPRYDSLLAKLVVHGTDRDHARVGLAHALDQLVVGGLVTTGGFHRWLLDQEPMVEARVTTTFLDSVELPSFGDAARGAAAAAAAWVEQVRRLGPSGPWSELAGWRLCLAPAATVLGLRDEKGRDHEVAVHPPLDCPRTAVSVDTARRTVAANVDGHTHTYAVPTRSERWAPADDTGHGAADAVVAPFPALVSEVRVAPGDIVAGGDVVVVIEAMKMLHSLTTRSPATVAEVRVEPGQQIETDQVLVTFAPGPAHDETDQVLVTFASDPVQDETEGEP